MDNALYYLSLNRMRGLGAEMTAVANNIANLATAGYRREGMVFSEFVTTAGGVGESVSMADMNVRYAEDRPGPVSTTGGVFDFAIEGPGFFAIQGPDGPELTRAGNFLRSADGLLVTQDGAQVLDPGFGPIFLPPEAKRIEVAADGSISADGLEVAALGIFAAPGDGLTRADRTAFASEAAPVPVEAPKVRQGALEGSNVDPVLELARMVEVTRAYERVQALIDDEDSRVRDTIERLGRPT